MFPKSVSGTSGKSRENKGDDMTETIADKILKLERNLYDSDKGDEITETSNDELRQRFFELILSNASQNEIVWWGQNRVRVLEQHRETLKSHLRDHNETIDELKAEIKRLTDQLSGNPTSPESDEDRHQRHRSERMLDEVTLICVSYGTEQMNSESPAEKTWGRMSRDIAEDICHGINEFDAEQ